MYLWMRNTYHFFLKCRKVNWLSTVYFNYKKFPYPIAKKLPVFFYGPVRFTDISGSIEIRGEVRKGMIGFGKPYEKFTVHKGIAEVTISGKVVFSGSAQFGKDYLIYVGPSGVLKIGHMASLASNGKIICTNEIIFGNYARIGAESQLIDTDFHPMINTLTGESYLMKGKIILGNYNYIGNRVSIMNNTITPDYCTIASNSLCNKDYRDLGQNILVGGIPCKLLKENISRDWENEKELFRALDTSW